MNLKEVETNELELELLNRYGDFINVSIKGELEQDVFKHLKGIDGLHEYLQLTLNKDILRYFAAQDEISRNLTRGAYMRTLYLKNRLKAKEKLDSTDNDRYKK